MTIESVDEDEPLTLAEACEIVFRGRITPDTLRAEAARGNLAIERIGRRDFVTRAAIKDMREKCRAVPQQKVPASGSSRSTFEPMEAPRPPAGASATMVDTSAALNSVLMTVQELNKLSKTTSRGNTRSRRGSLSLVKG